MDGTEMEDKKTESQTEMEVSGVTDGVETIAQSSKIKRLEDLCPKVATFLNGSAPTHTCTTGTTRRPRATYEVFALSSEASQMREGEARHVRQM